MIQECLQWGKARSSAIGSSFTEEKLNGELRLIPSTSLTAFCWVRRLVSQCCPSASGAVMYSEASPKETHNCGLQPTAFTLQLFSAECLEGPDLMTFCDPSVCLSLGIFFFILLLLIIYLIISLIQSQKHNYHSSLPRPYRTPFYDSAALGTSTCPSVRYGLMAHDTCLMAPVSFTG